MYFNIEKVSKYFVPGIVFQSCVIAGGYGTGRELVEYFMGYSTEGWLARHVYHISAGVVLICAISFMFAQIFKKYDYKSFMKELIISAVVLKLLTSALLLLYWRLYLLQPVRFCMNYLG